MQKHFTEWLVAKIPVVAGVLGLISLASTSLLVSASEAPEEEASATSYSSYLSQVDDRVVLAGALDLDALRASQTGSVEIIDLRTEPEGTPAEAAQADALGLGYTNIPVSSAAVDPAQVDALRAALSAADPDALIVVHCASGNRAGMLWGAAQLAEGVPLDTVRATVDSILTKQPAIDGLEAYAKTLDAH